MKVKVRHERNSAIGAGTLDIRMLYEEFFIGRNMHGAGSAVAAEFAEWGGALSMESLVGNVGQEKLLPGGFSILTITTHHFQIISYYRYSLSLSLSLSLSVPSKYNKKHIFFKKYTK